MGKLFDRSTKTGFTLVELVIVIAILGVLAGVAIPVYSNYVAKAHRAADEQLIAAVNTAAAAAVLEARGTDMAKLKTGALTADTSVSPITVTDSTNEDVAKSFEKFFKGNETAELKWYAGLNFVNGVFIGATKGSLIRHTVINGKEVAYSENGILTYKNSNLAKMSSGKTLKLVDSLASSVGVDHTVAQSLVADEKFKNYLVKLGLSADNDSEVARGLVFYATDRLASASAADITAAMTGNFDTDLQAMYRVVSGGATPTFSDKAVAAAMMYALTAGYANTDAGKVDANAQAVYNGEVHDLPTLTSYMTPLYQSEGFRNYLKSSDATKDAEGLIGAFGMLNSNEAIIQEYVSNAEGDFNSKDARDLINELLKLVGDN